MRLEIIFPAASAASEYGVCSFYPSGQNLNEKEARWHIDVNKCEGIPTRNGVSVSSDIMIVFKFVEVIRSKHDGSYHNQPLIIIVKKLKTRLSLRRMSF